jgi:hypothetical protein
LLRTNSQAQRVWIHPICPFAFVSDLRARRGHLYLKQVMTRVVRSRAVQRNLLFCSSSAARISSRSLLRSAQPVPFLIGFISELAGLFQSFKTLLTGRQSASGFESRFSRRQVFLNCILGLCGLHVWSVAMVVGLECPFKLNRAGEISGNKKAARRDLAAGDLPWLT